MRNLVTNENVSLFLLISTWRFFFFFFPRHRRACSFNIVFYSLFQFYRTLFFFRQSPHFYQRNISFSPRRPHRCFIEIEKILLRDISPHAGNVLRSNTNYTFFFLECTRAYLNVFLPTNVINIRQSNYKRLTRDFFFCYVNLVPDEKYTKMKVHTFASLARF